LAGAAQATAVSPEPSDYRMEEYRAPTPSTLSGATVLTTEQAHALWSDRRAAFIDVLPRPPRPQGLPASTIWHPKPRSDIPGSIWLPDTGNGEPAPAMETWFERNLQAATHGDRSRQLVFYSLADCSMSWNAARRAEASARHVAEKLDLGGWVAVEVFVTRDGAVLVNELAPRPHNSGHWTIDACVTSQFEQFVRAICGLPLGSPERHSDAVMKNLIGPEEAAL